MAFLRLLLLSAALTHTTQPLPAARGGGGRGLDSVGGVRRQRRDLQNLLPYQDQMMSYTAGQGGGGANNPYDQLDDWRGRGLDMALNRLVERDQRREEEEEEEEEQQAAYLAAGLRLLKQAQSRVRGPVEVEVVEEEAEDEEDEQGPQGDLQGPVPADYDETGRGLRMGRPRGAWRGLVGPRLAQALLDRMDPRLVQTLLDRADQDRVQQLGVSASPSRDEDTLRRLVARILSGDVALSSSAARLRARRDLSVREAETLGPAHRRSRRSLDDQVPPSPSDDPPLLRVKRLEDIEDEEKLRPHTAIAGLQRMKRIDTTAPDGEEELNRERRSRSRSRRRRRSAALSSDPQILLDQILEYMRE